MAEETQNPFPLSAVANHDSESRLNYPAQCQLDFKKRIVEFATDFAVPPPDERPGCAIAVRGALGSGKTHAILQMEKEFVKSLPRGKCIYTSRVLSADALLLYRLHFAHYLQLEDLENVLSAHMLRLLRDSSSQHGESRRSIDTVIVEEAERREKADKSYVLNLANEELVPAAALRALIDVDLVSASNQLRDDLPLAYSKLANTKDPISAALALRWFKVEALSDADLKDLGVKSRLETEADAMFVFRFLLRAFRKAGVPVMFSIDEFESFARRGDETSQRNAPSLLKDLAEMFSSTGHLLIISGISTAWDALPKDVPARIRVSVEMRLDEKRGEPEDLLRVYQKTDYFLGSALTELCEAANYNARQILELAHYAWNRRSAEGEKISSEQVRTAAKEALADPKRRGAAEAEIAAAAARNAFQVYRDSSPNPPYDFIIGDPDSPVAFVKISRSVFKADEVEDAKKIAEARHEILKKNPQARTCTVVIGYSTESLRQQLRGFGDSVVVYEEDTFPVTFDAFLQSAKTPVSPTVRTSNSDQDYEVLQNRFNDLAKQKKDEITALEQRLEAIHTGKEKQQAQEIAESAGQRLRATFDKLTAALEQEDRAIRTYQKSQDRDDIARTYDLQRDLVGYALFLNRVSPELPDLSEILQRYQTLTDKLTTYLSVEGLQSSYQQRLSLLRALRKEELQSRSPSSWFANSIRRGWLPIAFSAVGLVIYAALVSTSWVRTQNAVDSYRKSLAEAQVRVALDGEESATSRSALASAESNRISVVHLFPAALKTKENLFQYSKYDILRALSDEIQSLDNASFSSFVASYASGAGAIWLAVVLLPVTAWLMTSRLRRIIARTG